MITLTSLDDTLKYSRLAHLPVHHMIPFTSSNVCTITLLSIALLVTSYSQNCRCASFYPSRTMLAGKNVVMYSWLLPSTFNLEPAVSALVILLHSL